MDLYIRETKNTIINYLNSRNLPLEVKRLLLADILTEVEAKADEEIKIQLSARESEEKHDGN